MFALATQQHFRMKFKKYLKKSEAFVSGSFGHDTEDPLYQRELQLKGAIEQFLKATEDLDIMKKHKYYGKDLPEGFKTPVQTAGLNEAFTFFCFKPSVDVEESDMHAVIGVCTEAGELLEAMYNHKWKQKEFDLVNAKEEVGDIFWYLAILFRNHKWSIKSIWDRNIEKLTKRYGKKFSSEKAINRDTDAERIILEKKD